MIDYREEGGALPWHFPMTEPKSSLTDLRKKCRVREAGPNGKNVFTRHNEDTHTHLALSDLVEGGL